MLKNREIPYAVLVVEDDGAVANYSVSECLAQAKVGFEVTLAENVQLGIELLSTRKFDLILLDVTSRFTGLSGFLLKDIIDCSDSAIVIVIGHAQTEDLVMKAFKFGAEDSLNRDELNPNALMQVINKAVQRVKARKRKTVHSDEVDSGNLVIRSVFELHSDAMLILSKQHEIMYLNKSAAALLDADQMSLTGEIFPFKLEGIASTQIEIPGRNNQTHRVKLRSIEVKWSGQDAYLVVLHEYCPQQPNGYPSLAEYAGLDSLLNAISDAVIVVDGSGRIETLNPVACRLVGLAYKDAVGLRLAKFLPLVDLEGNRIPDPLQWISTATTATEAGETPKAIASYSRNDGVQFVLSIAVCRDLGHQATEAAHVFVIRDVTAEKRTEHARFQAEQLNAMSLLAAGIAHDFNNMLMAILGNISVAQLEIKESSPVYAKLSAAEKATLQAKDLAQQLLTFSKGGTPTLEATSLNQLVQDCANFILRGSNVICKLSIAENVWPVDADLGQIGQVLNNLIINADHAMGAGGTINLSLSNITLEHDSGLPLNPGDYVCIAIRDHGVGISEENLKRIFDPYFTTKDYGSGLGLASSHTIVKNHNGLMTVISELGKGSTFKVYLPKSAQAIPEKPGESPQVEDCIQKGEGRILIMDDMEAMMLVAGEIIMMLGYEVEYASNGAEAIMAYKKAKEADNPFDAVVFDLTVPGGMGGEEACKILKAYDPEIKAIASSGYSTSNIMSDYENSPFSAVVPKPYRIKEMSQALNRLLGA